MSPSRARFLLAIPLTAALALSWSAQEPESNFTYDEARVVTPTWLPMEEAYDPFIFTGPDGELSITSVVHGAEELWDTRAVDDASELEPLRGHRNPDIDTLAAHSGLHDGAKRYFVWEWADSGHPPTIEAFVPGRAQNMSTGAALAPRLARGRDGLWVVWQADNDGQYDVFARRVEGDSDSPRVDVEQRISTGPRGDWRPDVACTPSGDVVVVWDSFDGISFDVYARWRVDGKWKAPMLVAAGPAFQGRARVVSDSRGRVWCAWEEGALNWGRRFHGRDKLWNNVTDEAGPLHRFRMLHVAELTPDGVRLVEPALPQPAFARAAQRADKRDGVERLGVYYERPELTVDAEDRLWIAYRHYVNLQLGCAPATKHHIEEGWRVYARCLAGDAWSEPVAFEGHQRDGDQRLSVTPHAGGIALAWTTGRSDRRPKANGKRGVAWAKLAGAGPASDPELIAISPTADSAPVRVPRPAPEEHAGKTFELCFGDLHRHTDLSLCFPFYDGSLDDAYRYAIEVAGLDFLGITDHTRDIAQGDVTSQLWARSLKAADRYQIPGSFVPLYAYERSRGDTDHNVISLRRDILRPYQPPLPEFWAELDGDTFTIPHNPIVPKAWDHHDDAKRPLLEVYQGFRDQDSLEPWLEGLEKGHHLGLIASSDHLSTSTSYACVWSPERAREPIFRALQARRTYGATDKIRMVFTIGEHWMGERFSQSEDEVRLAFDVLGTATPEHVEVYVDGALQNVLSAVDSPDAEPRIAVDDYVIAGLARGEHWFHLRYLQADGGRAWSSPIWVTIE